jgi:glycosyltransferase involved in cell wall biosynthesis
LGQGGADRVTIILLQHLDRAQFQPSLVLMQARGEFLADVPSDVPVLSMDASNTATAVAPLTRLLRMHQPDILFSTSSGTNITASLAHRFSGSRARLVLSERNILYHGGRSAKRKAVVSLKRRLYRRADVILALSQGVKDDLVAELGLDASRIRVAYSPIDLEIIRGQMLEPVTEKWFAQDVPVIVAAGRFVPEKDFATLIAAFAKLRTARPARLILLGEGPLRAALEADVQKRGLSQDVSFPGFVKNPFKYMARASVFVVSSRHEGLCTVLIQAMACGAPVISTDYQVGAREIIQDGIDGFIVPVGDSVALAEKIEFYLDHPAVGQELSERASASARRFDITKQMDAHVRALLGDT